MADAFPAPYTIVGQIGQGGFATVYLASDEEGKPVAIKKFETEHGTDVDQEKAANELACLERLGDHANIVALRDVLEDENGVVALVLEYCEGGDLIKRMVRREAGSAADEHAAFHVWRQIVEGVAYLHANAIAHLDLKPQNVLLPDAAAPEAKLCDFSHSFIITPAAPLVPPSQVGAGKYMAPEVASGAPYDGKVADVWSCGVILYTLLCGALPFADTEGVKMADWRRVNWFSEPLNRLLEAFFVTDVGRRITLPEVLQSEWYVSQSSQLEGGEAVGLSASSGPLGIADDLYDDEPPRGDAAFAKPGMAAEFEKGEDDQSDTMSYQPYDDENLSSKDLLLTPQSEIYGEPLSDLALVKEETEYSSADTSPREIHSGRAHKKQFEAAVHGAKGDAKPREPVTVGYAGAHAKSVLLAQGDAAVTNVQPTIAGPGDRMPRPGRGLDNLPATSAPALTAAGAAAPPAAPPAASGGGAAQRLAWHDAPPERLQTPPSLARLEQRARALGANLPPHPAPLHPPLHPPPPRAAGGGAEGHVGGRFDGGFSPLQQLLLADAPAAAREEGGAARGHAMSLYGDTRYAGTTQEQQLAQLSAVVGMAMHAVRSLGGVGYGAPPKKPPPRAAADDLPPPPSLRARAAAPPARADAPPAAPPADESRKPKGRPARPAPPRGSPPALRAAAAEAHALPPLADYFGWVPPPPPGPPPLGEEPPAKPQPSRAPRAKRGAAADADAARPAAVAPLAGARPAAGVPHRPPHMLHGMSEPRLPSPRGMLQMPPPLGGPPPAGMMPPPLMPFGPPGMPSPMFPMPPPPFFFPGQFPHTVGMPPNQLSPGHLHPPGHPPRGQLPVLTAGATPWC